MRLVLSLSLVVGVACGQELAVGSAAPRVSLKDSAGETVQLPVPGSWTVLAFFPKAGASDCRIELETLRTWNRRIEACGAKVFAISTDSVERLEEFQTVELLPFKLLSDPGGVVARRYGGVFGERPFARRRTYVIDPEGVVRHVIQDVDGWRHGEEVKAALDRLRGVASGSPNAADDPDRLVLRITHNPPPGVAWSKDRPPYVFEGKQPESLKELRRWLRERADPTRFPQRIDPASGDAMKPVGTIDGKPVYASRKKLLIILESMELVAFSQATLQLCMFLPDVPKTRQLRESPLIYQLEVQTPDPKSSMACEIRATAAPGEWQKPAAARRVDLRLGGTGTVVGSLIGNTWTPPETRRRLESILRKARIRDPEGGVRVACSQDVPAGVAALLVDLARGFVFPAVTQGGILAPWGLPFNGALNPIVLEVIARYPTDGTHRYHWPKKGSWKGCTKDLVYAGKTLCKGDPEGRAYCCGLTFEVFLDAWRLWCEQQGLEDSIPGLDLAGVRKLQKQWFGSAEDKTCIRTALVDNGLGRHLTDWFWARAGDFVQLWRNNGSGHSVIFLEWVRERGKTVGLTYWSTQKSTNGIGRRTERFGKGKRDLDRDQFYLCRVGR